jgi:3',5'-cyclic AMP phosphodiesterase CpdA
LDLEIEGLKSPASTSTVFRLAHLSDPHLALPANPRWRDLLGKRLTGYVNWRLRRRNAHDMTMLAALVADVKGQANDHIVVVGDFANIGLPSEFGVARRFLQELGPPAQVSAVPGNHDVYVRGAARAMISAIGPWMTADHATGPDFPFLKRRGPIALIGLSSGIPTSPLLASGRLGAAQIRRLDAMLEGLGREKAVRVVLIHHPPHAGGATRLRQLTDGAKLRHVLARRGCELVLHGHNHRPSRAWLRGPNGPIPVIGAPSASAHPSRSQWLGWWLIEIAAANSPKTAISARLRCYDRASAIFTERGFHGDPGPRA